MDDLATAPIKVVKCKNCGADVVVNAKYPITSVDRCVYCPIKNDKNVWRDIYRAHKAPEPRNPLQNALVVQETTGSCKGFKETRAI